MRSLTKSPALNVVSKNTGNKTKQNKTRNSPTTKQINLFSQIHGSDIDLKTGYSHGKVVFHKAAVSEAADPELDAHDAKYEEDEEAEQQHVAQHGQCVQQEGHQDAHT